MLHPKFKSFIRDYFTLTSRERKGAIVLASIIAIQILMICFLNYRNLTNEIDDIGYPKEIIRFKEVNEKPKIEFTKFSSSRKNKDSLNVTKQYTFVKFNPNLISDTIWMQMGLSIKQTAVIRNYLNKGGVFRTKESVKKIYSILPEQYKKLEPFIEIPEKENQKEHSKNLNEITKKEQIKININTVDTVEMMELPLVGAGRARMIYKYREALGGFYDKSQLLEVFTIDTTTYMIIAPLLEIDTSKIKKININDENFKHPYISKQLAMQIKAYRKQHGNYTHLSELKHITTLNDQIYSKLVPYVGFE